MWLMEQNISAKDNINIYLINATGMYGTILLHEGAGGYVLVAVISFTVAVVITTLCIKFRKRGQKSQDAEDHVLKKGKVEV